MTKNDSMLCPACGQEFSMSLIEMVRRKHRWCDECVGTVDQKLREAAERADRVWTRYRDTDPVSG